MLEKFPRQQPGPALYRWYAGYDLLFAAYLVFLGILFFSSNQPAARVTFLAVVLPLAVLLPLTVARSLSAHAVREAVHESGRQLVGTLAGARSTVFWAAALYVTILLVSAALQPDANLRLVRRHAVFALELLAFLLVTGFLVVACRNFLTRFLTAMAVIAAAGALANIAVFVASWPLPAALGGYRLTPSIGMLGKVPTTISLTYALFLLGAVATGMRPGLSRGHRLVLLAASAILIVAIIWTQTRGAYLALLAGLAVVTASASRRVKWMMAGALSAVVLVGALVPAVREAMIMRGGSYRPDAWNIYLAMAWEYPFLGRGGLTDTTIKMANDVPAEHPHNLVLGAWVLGGAPAALAMLVIILGGLYWSAAYYRKYNNLAPLCLMIVMSVAGAFDYTLRITYPDWFWVTFWLPIGLCIGCETAVRRPMPTGIARSLDHTARGSTA